MQARNLAWKLEYGEISARFLVWDRDSKFTVGFDEGFRLHGGRPAAGGRSRRLGVVDGEAEIAIRGTSEFSGV